MLQRGLTNRCGRYRMNVHKLTDMSKTLDERAATFDGAMHSR
jgi:hypothetical protein